MKNNQKNIANAVEQLSGDCTFSAVLESGESFCSKERGIKPLMEKLQLYKDFFKNAAVADKVVGKAAALLMVYGNVQTVYAKTISAVALEVFQKFGTEISYETLVPRIENRARTGLCPMETLCIDCSDPKTAYEMLKANLAGK